MKSLYIIVLVLLGVGLFSSCEEEIAKNSGITDPEFDSLKVPTGVVTGNIIDNLGTSAVFSFSVSGDGGSELLDNGVFVSKSSDFSYSSKELIVGAAKEAQIGSFQVKVEGLEKSTEYFYRAYSYNANGITCGEIKSFTTSNVTFSPYKTSFNKAKLSDIADWVFDEYTGFDPDGVDLVWLNDDIGTTCLSCYWGGADLNIISPLVRVASLSDVLSFKFYYGGYSSPQTQVRVYITEDLEDYGTPVKDWSFSGSNSAYTNISLESYYEKSIYVVLLIKAGDFIVYDFAIAPPSN